MPSEVFFDVAVTDMFINEKKEALLKSTPPCNIN